MHNYRLTIAYDGTDFAGWQQQNNATSIQQLIRTAIETCLRTPVRLIGSGRTDAGVHALGQIAHFHAPQIPSLTRLHYSLNGLLPPSIRILDVEEVPATFHAQHSALGKIYHYELYLQPIVSPMKHLYAWRPLQPLNIALLQEAIPAFLGTHDFTTFTNKGSSSEDPVRTIKRIDLVPTEDGLRLVFEGNGFLYKMVRNITGALIAVASGKISPTAIAPLLAARDRRLAPDGAPAHGLFLVKVLY